MKLGVRNFGVLAAAFASLILAGAFLAGTTAAGPSTDADSDSVLDYQDNCVGTANTDQRDTNSDGFGNICDVDFNQDNVTNAGDLATFKANFGIVNPNPDVDVNGDNNVNAADLATFKSFFGLKPPGPSGHSCAGTIPCPS